VKYNTTIVITSDHTIFKPAVLKDFEEYSKEYELSFANGENYCPLIIFSPQIKDNVKVNDVCYQMDVYPTIMHLIDCDEYYWKGFGVNVLDSMARHNRPVTENEAYELSDKLIRSNYFNSFVH
jgi:phosphoglycerol transferase MdoB-like AlkP superfamily enzyme